MALQKPDATRVAGFEAWLALGCCPRRGGKALRIFAPCPPYRPKTKAIVVEAGHPANRQVKSLVHELAHALVRADRQDDDPELDAAAEELVAETTAYSVCASSGIDPGEYSITYLAYWSEHTPSTPIERTAALIDRLSRRIEEAVANLTLAEFDDDDAAAPCSLVAR